MKRYELEFNCHIKVTFLKSSNVPDNLFIPSLDRETLARLSTGIRLQPCEFHG